MKSNYSVLQLKFTGHLQFKGKAQSDKPLLQVFSTDNLYLLCREDAPGSQSDLNYTNENQLSQQAYTESSVGAELEKYSSSANHDLVVDRRTFQIRNALPYESW